MTSSRAGRLSLVLACLLSVFAVSSPADEDTEADSVQEDSVRSGDEISEQLENILDSEFRTLRSIIFAQEFPRLKLSWGATVMADIPLNDEPEDASSTLRSAYLSYRRAFGEDWIVRVTLDYNDEGNLELGSNYAIYSGWKSTTAKLGVFDPVFSLERISSRSGISMMERSLPVEALSERRSGGASFLRRTPTSSLNAGLFFLNPQYQGQSQSGQAIVLRYLHAPLAKRKEAGVVSGHDIWAGLSFSYRTNVSGSDTQFRSRPEVAVTESYYVDTGPIDQARNIIRVGLEASKVSGPFSWQTELLTARVDRSGRSPVTFWGGYALASWFLTGETRNYEPLSGRFLSNRPNRPLGKGGYGAFELAARASYVDLNDHDIVGGAQSNLSIGINWYPTERWRLMVNLVKVLGVDRPGSVYDDSDPLIIATRVQWVL